jgi:hypothetical protein
MEVKTMMKYIKTAVLVICIIVLFSPLTWASDEKAAEEVTGSGVYDDIFSEASEHSSNAKPSAQDTRRRIGDAAANEDMYGAKATKLTKIFQLKHAQASSLEKVISDLCSPEGKAVADKRTNSVVVTDAPAALDYIEQTISRLDTETPDMRKLAEDLEIMSRIIDKTLSGGFPDHYRVARTFTSIGSHQGCQGIYLKGYGAVFMTSISFPVAEQKPGEAEAAPDDLWQQTKYELSGAPGAMSVIGRGESGKYESEKVERLKEELLKLIGTYAHNIRQLGANENIVVAVRGTTGYAHTVSLSGMMNYVVKQGEGYELVAVSKPEVTNTEVWVKKREGKLEAKSELGKPELEKPELEKPEAAPEAPRTESAPITIPAPTPSTANIAVSKPSIPAIGTVTAEPGVGGRTTLIIRVSKSDAEDYRMGRFDLDELGDRTEVIQY